MNVSDALRARKSTRAFLDREVEHEKIERLLKAAGHSPSGVNTQPWQVAVVSGARKVDLCARMEESFRSGQKGQMEYQYYPLEWQGVYKERRKACGLQLYSTLQISREDKQRQLDQWAANYRGFDAPVILFFFIDRIMETGSIFDYGMFYQSVMLAAVEEGLATCPQASLAEYPDIVKQQLGYGDDTMLLCGMALGYEDTEAVVNSYRTPREKLESFVRFFE